MAKRKNQSEMAELVRLGEQREGSLELFCRDYDINVATYYYWRKKLRSVNGRSNFVPMSVKEELSESSSDSAEVAIVFFKKRPSTSYLRLLVGLND